MGEPLGVPKLMMFQKILPHSQLKTCSMTTGLATTNKRWGRVCMQSVGTSIGTETLDLNTWLPPKNSFGKSISHFGKSNVIWEIHWPFSAGNKRYPIKWANTVQWLEFQTETPKFQSSLCQGNSPNVHSSAVSHGVDCCCGDKGEEERRCCKLSWIPVGKKSKPLN